MHSRRSAAEPGSADLSPAARPHPGTPAALSSLDGPPARLRHSALPTHPPGAARDGVDRWIRAENGAAVVDFVLVTVVLLPLVLGVLHLALVLHVRNTMTAAASDGARLAATVDRGPADGVRRTRDQIAGALSERFARDISARAAAVDGQPGVEVRVVAVVPALGLWGPATRLEMTGHAIEEPT